MQVFPCTQRKNTEIAMNFGVFFENQIELRAISAGFDLNPKLGQTLTQKFVIVKDFVLVVTGARRVRLVSAEQTALRSQIAGNLQIR